MPRRTAGPIAVIGQYLLRMDDYELNHANKYTSLISNTVIFGISTFGSKVLTLILTRLYTEILSPDAIALSVLLTNACNLILPVMYLGIAESVIRFAMDQEYRRADVLSVGILTVLLGWGVLWCFYPLTNNISDMEGYGWLISLYCISSAMRTVITGFVRASGLIRMFAIDGIITTATTLGFNLLFMIGFQMGSVGYVLGTVVADALSALSLFLILRLYRFVHIRGIQIGTIRDMLRYALPLVPTAVFWWITSASDIFFIKTFVSVGAAGIYGMSQRIPNLIMQISTFFTRAWELSAFTEYNKEEGERFFSNVFCSYYTFVFMIASLLIICIKPLTQLLLSAQYYSAWRASLFLILSVSFSCLVTFLGAIYNAARQNKMMSVTTFIGALLNLLFNWILIPKWQTVGAAFATFASYFIVFLIRAVDTRRYIRVHMQPRRMIPSILILILQIVIMLYEVRLWLFYECLLALLLMICNFSPLLFLTRRIFSMVLNRRSAG